MIVLIYFSIPIHSKSLLGSSGSTCVVKLMIFYWFDEVLAVCRCALLAALASTWVYTCGHPFTTCYISWRDDLQTVFIVLRAVTLINKSALVHGWLAVLLGSFAVQTVKKNSHLNCIMMTWRGLPGMASLFLLIEYTQTEALWHACYSTEDKNSLYLEVNE